MVVFPGLLLFQEYFRNAQLKANNIQSTPGPRIPNFAHPARHRPATNPVGLEPGLKRGVWRHHGAGAKHQAASHAREEENPLDGRV